MESNRTLVTLEHICLVCNQLFTSNDMVNHLLKNKDHIEHCIQIDKVKVQLLDINNNNHADNNNIIISNNNSNSSNNNNSNENSNIFKERLEILWSSLKRLSTTHSLLNSKIKEIRNHFEIIFDYLMSMEHSLKKQIQVDIDLINNDITHQIDEFKSIINIVNINTINKNNNTINNNSSEGSKLETTNTLSLMIESIKKSESYNHFIENNNTFFYNNNNDNNNIEEYNNNSKSSEFLNFLDKHIKNFKSGVLNPTEIELESKIIKENLYIVKVKQDQVYGELQKIIKDSIIINETPSSLVLYGDLERIKQYYKRNNINKLEYNYNSKSKQQTEIKETIIEILKSNRIDILKYLIQDLHFDITTQFKPDLELFRIIEKIDLLAMSTIYSNLETIQFIEKFGISNKVKWNYEICLELSPFSNNIKILKYFSTKVIGMIDSELINNIYVSGYAALLGHIDMIEFISKDTPFPFIFLIPYTQFCIDVAAWNGNLETIKWLHENRSEGCTTYAMNYAGTRGHLETIKWLHENRTEGCTTNAINYAASGGHLETIKWLHENRTEGCTTDAMNYAAISGELETIKWLHENRTEGCTTHTVDKAAMNGHLETIKWLHHNRTEGCTTDAMDNASQNGHLETIIWLHENRTEGCTTDAMDYAAFGGHLETIKWFHDNRSEGCTANALNYSSQNGHLETIKWLHQNRSEGCVTDAIKYAKDNNHFEVFEWLNSLK